MVVFSRWYYTHPDEDLRHLTEECRKHVSMDAVGRHYQDFYRLLVQNEHYENWQHLKAQLRRVFYSYKDSIESRQRQGTQPVGVSSGAHHLLLCSSVVAQGAPLPRLENSCASDGSFLEVLNICMNAFDLHLLDRRSVLENCSLS